MRKLLLFTPFLLLGQTPPAIGPKSTALWDEVTLDVDGNPEQIGSYSLGIVRPGEDLNIAGILALKSMSTLPTGWQGTQLDGLLSGLPGGSYRVQAKAVDLAGNESWWSVPLDFFLDGAPPLVPVGLRLQRR